MCNIAKISSLILFFCEALLLGNFAHAKEGFADHSDAIQALVAANKTLILEKPSFTLGTKTIDILNLGATVEIIQKGAQASGGRWVKVKGNNHSRINAGGWVFEPALAYPDMFTPVTHWTGPTTIELSAGDYFEQYNITSDGRFVHEWSEGGEKLSDSGKVFSYFSILLFRSEDEQVNKRKDNIFVRDGYPIQYIFRDGNGRFCDYTGIKTDGFCEH